MGGKKGGGPAKTRVEVFNDKVAGASTKAEERILEETLLVPEKIPAYTGKKAAPATPRDYAVTFFFRDAESLALVQKHFRVSSYVEKAVSNVALLLALLEKLESGELSYDVKTKQLTVPSDGGGCEEGSAPVDTREQGPRNRTRSRP